MTTLDDTDPNRPLDRSGTRVMTNTIESPHGKSTEPTDASVLNNTIESPHIKSTEPTTKPADLAAAIPTIGPTTWAHLRSEREPGDDDEPWPNLPIEP